MSSPRGSTTPNLRPSSPAHLTGRLHRVPSSEVLTAHPLLSMSPSAALTTGASATNVNSSVHVNGTSSSTSSLHSSSESPVSVPLVANATSSNPSAPSASTPPASSQYPAQMSAAVASASSTTTTTTTTTTTQTTTPPKYLPYTPRHTRVVTSSATATTGTANSPVSISPQPHHHAGGSAAPSATSRLQLQNLKAVAQHHGLDASCLGWAMLEELVAGSDHIAAWTEVWAVIATGKATLLLPTEVTNSREVITPEFVKDHIIFCEGSARDKAPFVTLSGLRGIIDGSDLFIRSTVPTSSKSFKALSDPATRSSALATLPPLPELASSAIGHAKFHAYGFISSLPVPPRSVPPKPPLPPRPGTKPAPHVSRLPNPFASFFSKSQAPASPAPPAQPLPDVQPVDHVVEVSAFTIDHALVRRSISKALGACFKAEIKDALAGVPSWISDRVQNFSSSLLPFPRPLKARNGNNGSQSASDQSSILEVSAYDDSAEELSERFQEFYEGLENELRVENSPTTLKRKDDKLTEEKQREKDEMDAKVQNALEKVERALTNIFYDRLYRPSSSDDASHDEALSSRITALNKLDLSLDHLGVDAGDSRDDVYRIVEACGQTISQLEVARCPADKAAILVASHRIIVDGLSRLPPLHLKSDEPIDDDKTPQGLTFSQDVRPKEDTKGDRSESPTRLTVSPDPLSPLTESNTEEKAAESSRIATEEGKTTETIKIPLLEDGASVKSVPSVTLSPAAEEPATPLLSVSPPKTPTPVSGDILLPLIIFSVVKANPPQLVSHLLFTQRFRNQSIGGEESYCLINLMAVVEFLENVDLAALGLTESEKDIRSTAGLTPIPLSLAGDKSPASTPGGGLRGRVEQQVDAIAGSANKVLSGVVDSGFGVLRSLLPAGPPGDQTHPGTPGHESAPWNISKPGFGLLRRESGFSIASLAASLPGRERARSVASTSHHGGAGAGDEEGQEMVESRPGSIRNMALHDSSEEEEEEDEEEEGEEESEEGEEEDEDGEFGLIETRHDTRSIRSFESMMSSGRSRSRNQRRERKGGRDSSTGGGRGKRTDGKGGNVKKERMSITDRLAHMSRLTKNAALHSQESSGHQDSPPPRSTSLLTTAKENTQFLNRFDTPISSRTSSPIPIINPRPSSSLPQPNTHMQNHSLPLDPLSSPAPSLLALPPPNRRFLECSASGDDLKVSEISELLKEYRRLVEGVRALGAFDEHT